MRIYLKKTHCKWGHEYTPENTVLRGRKQYRGCRICRARHRADDARRNPDRDKKICLRWYRDHRPHVLLRARIRQLKKRNLTLEQYEEQVVKQNHCCALCGKGESKLRKDGSPCELAVDHDHDTDANRELLCRKCNTALGLLYDDPILLRKAAAYIEQHRTQAEAA